jgi:C1A family cysteine protease
VLGGHMQTIVGWEPARDAFIVRNTWGPWFGIDDGYALVAASYINRYARDLWVVQTAPEVR